METVLMILGELEHLENLVKLARRRRDSETTENQKVSTDTREREASISWKDAHVDQGSDGVPDQDRETVNEGGAASVSDSDDENDDGEYYDSESSRFRRRVCRC
ncbi:unnamed protein product [Sphagnum troendelagicum]